VKVCEYGTLLPGNGGGGVLRPLKLMMMMMMMMILLRKKSPMAHESHITKHRGADGLQAGTCEVPFDLPLIPPYPSFLFSVPLAHAATATTTTGGQATTS